MSVLTTFLSVNGARDATLQYKSRASCTLTFEHKGKEDDNSRC